MPTQAPPTPGALPTEVEALRAELATLRASEASFRVLLDESSDPIFSFLPDGTYRYVNQAFARGVGKAREEIIGRRIFDVFPPAEAEKRFAVLRQVFRTGLRQDFDVRVPRPDGDRHYLTTVQPVIGEGGAVVSAMCSSKDITDRKRMEGELRERLFELEAALAHVKQLQGIIPICAHCHAVRRAPESWQRLEAYVAEHSEATFSHGICPDCLARHYPEDGRPGPDRTP
jgi:PAS domain S-box-containing protein